MTTIKLNNEKLQQAIKKVNNKIELSQQHSPKLLKLKSIKSKLKEINRLHLVLLNNKTAVKINLNGLLIAKKKAKLKGVKFSIMNNINFYLNLCEDIQLYKSVVTSRYNLLVKI